MRACLSATIALTAASLPAIAFAQAPAGSPQPNVGAVQWPEQAAISASANVPALSGLERTKLPVLIPTRLLTDPALVFVGEETSYTASVREQRRSGSPAATLSITGTRIAFDQPDGRRAAPAQEASDRTAEVGEQSASAGYVRFGVAYRVDVECADRQDRRCATVRFARELLNSVELAGGGRGDPTIAPAPPAPPEIGMVSASSLPPDFFRPAGELVPHSGDGVKATTVYVPNIRFPVEEAPAYLNSQVYGVGGISGPSGSASDPRNYRYPWHDNFCELRSRATPMCPSGKGHQGQDIRPMGPGVAKYWAVAAERGRISRIGSYSVVLVGASGTEYRYLHLEMDRLDPKIKPGAAIAKGDHIGLISNNFGTTRTTVHLHFEMLQNLDGRGLRHVPPYTSLVAAYQQL